MGSPTLLLAVLFLFAISRTPAQATDFTIFGNVNYNGGVSGAAIVRALDANGSVADQVSVADGNGSYSLSVPEGQAYDIKAFIDGNDNGNLDADWTVGEPYAHHGDWNDTTESFNLLQVDGNRTGIDLDITWHGDNDNDGFDDWEEYAVGSNGDDNSSFPVTLSGSITFDGDATGSVRMELRPNAGTATVTVKMLDDYGDGWNGALLTIKDDSNQTAFSGTLHDGDENETGVELEAGNNYFVSVTSGEYPEEVSWNIHAAGAVIASGGSPVTRQAFSPSVELMKKTLPQPGAYQWKLPNNGSYELSAFLDLDEDGESDLSEPFGFHAGGLVTLSSASLSGINIELPWNNAPTDIHLSGATVAENHSAGIVVGELNATDSNDDDTHYYEFVDGNGSAHNHLFVIDANGTVRTTAILDYEANATLNIRVKVTDDENASLEQTLTIAVTNVIEDLDGDGIEDHADLDDDGDGFTDAREIEAGSNPDDNESFLISLSGSVTYEGNASGSVLMQVRSTTGPTMVTVEMIDSYGDGWNGAQLIITDEDNETTFTGTCEEGYSSLAEIQLQGGHNYFIRVTSGEYPGEVSWNIHSAGAVVASGGAPVTGQDFSPFGNLIEVTLAQLGSYQLELPNNTTYQLGAFLDVDGDGNKFPLEPAGLHSKEPILVSGNLSEINIEMIDNAAPNDLVLSAGSVTENQPLGTFVGTFTATDPDDSNGSGAYSFYLVGGEGSDANWAFAIEGNQLRNVFSLDYEDDFEPGPIEYLSYHPIRVRVSDNRGASIEKTFFITVSDDPLDNPLQVPMVKVDPPDGTKEDLFGSSVSLLGDLLLVGATEADLGDRNDTGATYLFRIEANGSSTFLSKLTAHDGNEGDSFGTSASQSGDFLAIGATRADMNDRNDTGAAYVFHMETNDGTTLVAKVAAPDGSEGDGFGHSVSITDEFLSVGAPFSAEGEDGAVYLYRMEANGSISHLTKLMAPDDTVGGNFGHSISESDDLLLIGANKADVDDQGEAGKAYLYRMETNGSATYLTRLTAPDGEEGDRFGQSVSQEGEFLAVGAPFADHNGISDAGIVYLYKEETNGSVTLLAKVTAVDSAKGDGFGMAISQSDDLLAVMSGNGIYLYRVDANGSSIATALGKVSLNWQPEALYLAGDKLVVGHKRSELVHVVDLALLNNTAPTNLHLGNSTVAENQAHDTVVGNLHAIDPDDQNGSGIHFHTLTDGNGSDHNLLFHIDENGILRTKVTFDYETSPTLSIRVRTTDEFDASFEKVFSINVTNVVEDLDGDGIENHADLDDDGDGFTDTEEIEGGSNPDDNASFLITISGTVTYEGSATGKVRVMVLEEQEGEIEIEMIDSYGDGWNGAELTILDDANVTVYLGTFEIGYEARDTIELMAGRTYFVNVSEGEYPEEVSWNIFSESQVLASGDTSSAGEVFLAPGLVTEIVLAQTGTYQLTVPSNLPFLVGAFLDLDDDGRIAPLEPAALHSEEPIIAAGNLSGINIEIVDNVAPTNLSLSVGPVTENRQAGSFVGIFSATDPDDLNGTDSYFFDLVEGNGSDHNHHFAIDDNQLKAVSPDYESGPIHTIRVRASDDRGAFLEKTFFITVIDDPMDNPLELESSTLFSSEPSDEDQFGSAVALLGDLLAIGATQASGVDANRTGAAYLYDVEANGTTTYLNKLTAPDGSEWDYFGNSISLSHDLLAVGATRASGVDENRTGAVYLYGVEANGSTNYLTKLTAPDGTERDYFGSSISLSHDLLAVGATGAGGGVDENRTGAVYLYGIEANGSTTYLTKLTAPTGTKSEGFGFSISQSGSLLAVAAGWADLGGVYLYRTESNGTATYLTKLTAPDGVAEDWFGSSVGVLDNIVAVGASGVDHNGMGDAGAVYLYRTESNGTATYLTKLMAPDARSYSYFGHLVSQADDLLAIGSKIGTYLYRVDANGSSITTLGKATLHGENIDENFRTEAISLSGELLAVGIKLDNPEVETDEEEEGDSGEETSVVHIFSLSNLNNNRSPSDLRLSNATVDENKNPGTLVGQLQVVDLDDQNGTDQYHFELVDGNGSQHNHLFSQANGELKTNAFLDYESNATLSIRVRVTDKYNGTLEIPLEVKVIDTFAPIVRTLTVETDANGSATFRGEILTDGNSDITVVGVKVSDGLNFVNPMILPGTLNGSTGEFTVTVTGLTAGERYFYRAYATNVEGTGHGARKRVVTPQATSPAPPQWWSTAGETDGGWRVSPWLGAFLPFDNGWMLHADMGWLYAQPDGTDGLWLWNETHGWLWTNAESFRYLYSSNLSEWLYFLKRKDGRAYFYNYATGSVE